MSIRDKKDHCQYTSKISIAYMYMHIHDQLSTKSQLTGMISAIWLILKIEEIESSVLHSL